MQFRKRITVGQDKSDKIKIITLIYLVVTKFNKAITKYAPFLKKKQHSFMTSQLNAEIIHKSFTEGEKKVSCVTLQSN